jgi:hypothetical protein
MYLAKAFLPLLQGEPTFIFSYGFGVFGSFLSILNEQLRRSCPDVADHVAHGRNDGSVAGYLALLATDPSCLYWMPSKLTLHTATLLQSVKVQCHDD